MPHPADIVLDANYAGPFAFDAMYFPPGVAITPEGGVPCRVMRAGSEAGLDIGGLAARARIDTDSLRVRASQLAAPAKGGRFVFGGGEIYQLTAAPERFDRARREWTCETLRLSTPAVPPGIAVSAPARAAGRTGAPYLRLVVNNSAAAEAHVPDRPQIGVASAAPAIAEGTAGAVLVVSEPGSEVVAAGTAAAEAAAFVPARIEVRVAASAAAVADSAAPASIGGSVSVVSAAVAAGGAGAALKLACAAAAEAAGVAAAASPAAIRVPVSAPSVAAARAAAPAEISGAVEAAAPAIAVAGAGRELMIALTATARAEAAAGCGGGARTGIPVTAPAGALAAPGTLARVTVPAAAPAAADGAALALGQVTVPVSAHAAAAAITNSPATRTAPAAAPAAADGAAFAAAQVSVAVSAIAAAAATSSSPAARTAPAQATAAAVAGSGAAVSIGVAASAEGSARADSAAEARVTGPASALSAAAAQAGGEPDVTAGGGGARTAPSFRSGAGVTASYTVAAPAGVAAGDLLIACFIEYEDAAGTINLPSGWTAITGTLRAADSPGSLYCRAAYKIAGASEPSSYTFSSTGAEDYPNAVIAAYTGADTSDPIGAVAANDGAGVNRLLPAVTAPHDNSARIGISVGYFGSPGTWTGMTQRASANSGYIVLMDQIPVDAGEASGLNSGQSDLAWVGISIAVNGAPE